MRQIVFATNNKHKLDEVRNILADEATIVSLDEIECFDEIPETSDTLEGNAALKARFVFEKYGLDCFADDTGLEIDALQGRPGVFSARYAGEPSNPVKNMDKVLSEMLGMNNREARFRTVICLIESGEERFFEGKIEGAIATHPRGTNGFGYDPVFIPEGYSECFAELSSGEKNKISHRALAVEKLAGYFGKSDKKP